MLHKGYYRYSEGFCAARLLYRVNWGKFTSKNVSEINIIQILARDVSPITMMLHICRRTITHDSSSGGGDGKGVSAAPTVQGRDSFP